MPLYYSLPTGKVTSSVKRYIHCWRRLSQLFLKNLPNVRIVGCDPGILFGRVKGCSFNLDTDICLKLYKGLTGKEYSDV
jgi:hypothetical protein